MKKYYENPSLAVMQFGMENVVTDSGIEGQSADVNTIEAGEGSTYQIKRIDAANISFVL